MRFILKTVFVGIVMQSMAMTVVICLAQEPLEIKTDFIYYVNMNREHILTLIGRRPELDERERKFADVLKQPIQNGISKSDRYSMLCMLFSLGMFPYKDGTDFTSGFIEDSIILEIVVYALFDSERDVRDTAFKYLSKYTKHGQLNNYSGSIKQALDLHSYSEETSLLSLVILSDEEKNEIFEIETISLKIKARLGDIAAENELGSFSY